MFSFTLTVTVIAVLLVLLLLFGGFFIVVALVLWRAERQNKTPRP